MTIDEARAHQQYDDCMFCPGCSRLLTGLHMGSMCYINWIGSKIRRKDMSGGNEEPIIIGLAIIGIGIVCLMDALKNKLKGYVRNKYNKKG